MRVRLVLTTGVNQSRRNPRLFINIDLMFSQTGVGGNTHTGLCFSY